MEKLIELLNEFEEYNKNCEFGKEYNNYTHKKWEEYEFEEDLTKNSMNIAFILSKKYGFIQWLVENEKIEWRKVIEKEIESGLKLVRVKDFPNKVIEEDKEELLMLLSIQDNPIEFLISILK